jgi:hypothetical protein
VKRQEGLGCDVSSRIRETRKTQKVLVRNAGKLPDVKKLHVLQADDFLMDGGWKGYGIMTKGGLWEAC